MPDTLAISASRVTKLFARAAALRGVDAAVEAGEKVAILGANGAGKTTFLRLVATLEKPTAGSLSVDGFDTSSDGHQARAQVGLVGHQTLLHPELTVLENLRFYGRLYGVRELEDRIAVVLALTGLAERGSLRVAVLSRGQQQRLALARAILHEPPILLLDEPDTGLDADGRAVLERIIAEPGRTVLFSSHNADWATRLANRTLTLIGGTVAP